MKRIKGTAIYIFLIAMSLAFLYSCAFLDQQTQQETKEPSSITPAVSEETKRTPKVEPQEVKEQPKKSPAVHKKHREQKPALKDSDPKTSPAGETLSNQQKKYYNDGMRYYTQAKYHEAKEAWQEVIKMGPKTKLAAKARNYILKADQKLKFLEQMK
jgi:TolA-binding protein